ncbi:thiamine-monophosphate kinase [Ectothiorhodospira sp. PHS-1]|uniref:thiamine-phosphate kinase n=1 Tax=Ectothiorhodospira sp. PHS-1 TaxID=519989 RepID=UPI00024A8394|nr:thiamine-phosphate kinase [Ectothiorhodospira sp. PHS-1]EHQ52191.1 thiamine-monophosphate kinase [Ectothiorhodospira sp. PHS-1]
MKEFDLIRRHFTQAPRHPDVILGVGDDAALLRVPPGHELVVSVDTLIQGVHFPAQTPPAAVGHKALAVNLSDLAAMGAMPRWITLALTLPDQDPDWLGAFARGLLDLARQHGVELVGGDTTRGPLSITVQIMGVAPVGAALRRRGARPGDRIMVTGTPGDAALALQRMLAGQALDPDDPLRRRLDRPTPRVAAGLALRGLASACIDISDGLCQDLGHVLTASGVGATLRTSDLPLSAAFLAHMPAEGIDWSLPLAGGDDYELLFTVPPERVPRVHERLAGTGCPVTEIGEIEAESGLRVLDPAGDRLSLDRGGYDHFQIAESS